MGVLQDRMTKVSTARQRVLDHCMCWDLIEDRYYYMIILPPGYFPDGIRASKEVGATNALNKIHDAMERVWVESYP